MATITTTLGIASFTAGLISKVTTTKKLETKVIMDFSGAFGAAESIDPTFEFSVSGYGSYPTITLGAGSSNIPSSVSGGTIIIEKFSKTEKSDDFQSWEYSGKGYPNAS